MPLNKTTDEIVIRVIELLSSLSETKYPHDRPAKNAPEKYFVVNGFCTSTGIMQKFVINVNCHAKNISGNIDRVTLNEMSVAVLGILEEYDSPGVLIIEIESQEIISEPQSDEHYSNLRFIVKSINN